MQNISEKHLSTGGDNTVLGEGRMLSDDDICKVCQHYSKKVENEDGGGYGYCKYQKEFVDADDCCRMFTPFA